MSLAPLDFLAETYCQLVPGVTRWGPGWYLVAANTRVEAGPFPDQDTAEEAARWLDDECYGVHPGPWVPRWSSTGLLVGSRIRDRKKSDTSSEELAPTG